MANVPRLLDHPSETVRGFLARAVRQTYDQLVVVFATENVSEDALVASATAIVAAEVARRGVDKLEQRIAGGTEVMGDKLHHMNRRLKNISDAIDTLEVNR